MPKLLCKFDKAKLHLTLSNLFKHIHSLRSTLSSTARKMAEVAQHCGISRAPRTNAAAAEAVHMYDIRNAASFRN